MPPLNKATPRPAAKPASTPAAPAPAAKGPQSASTMKGLPKVVLPTTPKMPLTNPTDYCYCFYGPPGVGKTTFVNGFGRVLFLSTDRGTRQQATMSVECNDWPTFMAVTQQLEGGASSNYDYVCVDHVADWADMCETWVLKKLRVEALTDAGYGKGWSLLKKELGRFMQIMKRLKLGLVFIAHEDTKNVKVAGKELNKVSPLMSKQAHGLVMPLVDIVGYCGMKPMIAQGKRKEVRVLETIPRVDLYAKDRLSHLRKRPPGDCEPLDGRMFIETFRK